MRRFRRRFVCLLPVLALLLFAGCGKKEEIKPPAPNIVATYDNGEITVEDLEKYSAQVARGLKLLAGDSLMELEDQILKEKEIYNGLITELMLDDMVKRKIKEKQLDNRGNIRHALEHLEENFSLKQLHSEMHEKDRIPVGEMDILNYYDENRDRFEDKPFYEVRDEIKDILVSQNEEPYIKNYIADLKDAATITRDYDILLVPEPTEYEVMEAYEKDRENYRVPERWVIEQIEIADTTAKAKDRAQKAWLRLGSGENFEIVAEEFGAGNTFTVVEYAAGMRDEPFDETVTSLDLGEYCKPVQDDGKYFILRLKERIPTSYIPLETVKEVIRRFIMDDREEKLYEQDENKTLFTIHGRRFTLGDFYQEFKELPPMEQEKHRSYEDRVKLVDRMVERLLLLEDSYDRMLNAEDREEIEHVREDILKQALHREEIDEKLEVTDDEVERYYEEVKEHFQTPPRVKISMIVVRQGRTDEAEKKAKEKIDEAYAKLNPGFLRKGMPFEEVAREYSEDQRTAEKGGELNRWISESNDPLVEMFNHSFHEKFIDLKEGEITEPFSMGHDYFIVKVRQREEPKQKTFDEVKEHVKGDLNIKKHQELTAGMYQDMIDKANLVIYDQVLESIINKQKEVSAQ